MHVIEFPFNKIVRVYYTAYYRLKNTFRYFSGAASFLKSFENFGKCPGKNGVSLSKLQVFRLQPLALPSMLVKFFKIPEITSAVEFIFTEAGTIRSSTRDLSTQF